MQQAAEEGRGCNFIVVTYSITCLHEVFLVLKSCCHFLANPTSHIAQPIFLFSPGYSAYKRAGIANISTMQRTGETYQGASNGEHWWHQSTGRYSQTL